MRAGGSKIVVSTAGSEGPGAAFDRASVRLASSAADSGPGKRAPALVPE